MNLTAISISVTTASNGAGSGLATRAVPAGKLYAAQWIKGTLADGVDAVLSTVNADGAVANLLTLTDANADALYYPRALQHSEAGAALTGTAGGDRCQPLVAGTLKLTLAQGGDAKTGRMVVYVEEGD